LSENSKRIVKKVPPQNRNRFHTTLKQDESAHCAATCRKLLRDAEAKAIRLKQQRQEHARLLEEKRSGIRLDDDDDWVVATVISTPPVAAPCQPQPQPTLSLSTTDQELEAELDAFLSS
jgi:hypothetical protein